MPHLHLPIDHTDADLVLAANVADVVGSEDLYVAWSHDGGPGAVPEVEAVVREERAANPLVGLLTAVRTGLAALWHTIFTGPSHRTTRPAAPTELPRRAAGEPSA
jgi:hypothetical protein